MKKLYVGKLLLRATEGDPQERFGQAGFRVTKITLIRDRLSGESRGFGFVEVTSHDEAHRAILLLNGKNFLGSPLVVNDTRSLSEGCGSFGSRGGHRGWKK